MAVTASAIRPLRFGVRRCSAALHTDAKQIVALTEPEPRPACQAFAVMLFMEPAAGGALGLVWLIGCYAMVFGIFGIFFGFRLRSLRTPLAA